MENAPRMLHGLPQQQNIHNFKQKKCQFLACVVKISVQQNDQQKSGLFGPLDPLGLAVSQNLVSYLHRQRFWARAGLLVISQLGTLPKRCLNLL